MWQAFKDWLKQPFSSDMSARDWFFFVGLLIVIMVLWRLILKHVFEGLE